MVTSCALSRSRALTVISSLLPTVSQTWVGHTPPRRIFFSIEIFICTPGHSSAVFLLCGWWWSICTVYWIEIFICWEFYSPLSGVLGSLHGHGSQGVVRLFHTDCTISYHLLHHFVPFFCTRFKHCVPPHHTVHRDFTLKHCAHQCNVQEAVHGNGKYSHVGLFSSSMFNLEARR